MMSEANRATELCAKEGEQVRGPVRRRDQSVALFAFLGNLPIGPSDLQFASLFAALIVSKFQSAKFQFNQVL